MSPYLPRPSSTRWRNAGPFWIEPARAMLNYGARLRRCFAPTSGWEISWKHLRSNPARLSWTRKLMKNRWSQARTTAILKAIKMGPNQKVSARPQALTLRVQISIGWPEAVRVARFRVDFHGKPD